MRAPIWLRSGSSAAITSCSRMLTELVDSFGIRGRIEHRSHGVRDVTFANNRSPVRDGSTPAVMAALRNRPIGLLRVAGKATIDSAGRHLAAQPATAFAPIGLPPDN